MHETLITLFVLCLLLSFFLSGMEAGVFALSRLRIRHFAREGQRRARVLQEYLDSPENFLWTILIGNTLATVVVVSIGVRWLYGWLAPGWIWLTVSLMLGTLAFYAGFELLPKTLFRLYPNRLCLALALPFRLVHVTLRPLVGPVALFSRALLWWSGGRRFTGHLFGNRDELRMVMQESGQALTSEERGMISRVLDLQNLTVAAIATPMTRAVTIEAGVALGEALARVRESGFTRVPVWRLDGHRRRIAGLLDLSALLYNDKVETTRLVADLIQPALYIEEETRLEVALRQMQRTGQRLAIVLGRNREEVGIMTLQDILKMIFGGVRT